MYTSRRYCPTDDWTEFNVKVLKVLDKQESHIGSLNKCKNKYKISVKPTLYTTNQMLYLNFSNDRSVHNNGIKLIN